jgi:hypothetical protein
MSTTATQQKILLGLLLIGAIIVSTLVRKLANAPVLTMQQTPNPFGKLLIGAKHSRGKIKLPPISVSTPDLSGIPDLHLPDLIGLDMDTLESFRIDWPDLPGLGSDDSDDDDEPAVPPLPPHGNGTGIHDRIGYGTHDPYFPER